MTRVSAPGPFGAELVRRGEQIAVSTRRHDFVRQLADGSLPAEVFLAYLVQNALFLTGYAAALRAALEAGMPPPVAELLTTLETAISGPAIGGHVTEYRSRVGRAPDLAMATPSPVTAAKVGGEPVEAVVAKGLVDILRRGRRGHPLAPDAEVARGCREDAPSPQTATGPDRANADLGCPALTDRADNSVRLPS